MMDLGPAIALSTLIITILVVIIKYIPKRPQRENGKCAYHDGIVKTMNEFAIDQKTPKRLVMAIAAKMNVTVKDIKNELQDVIGGE